MTKTIEKYIETRIDWLDRRIVRKELDIHLTSCKKSEKSLEPFLRKLRYQSTNQLNIEVSDFGLIWRRFREYLQIKNFFQKSDSVTFLPLQSFNLMKKSEKSLESFLRKLRYQPTEYYQQHWSYRTSLTSVEKEKYWQNQLRKAFW